MSSRWVHRITARSYRSWVLVLGMVVIAGGAYFAWHHWHALEAERQAKSKPPAAIPATVAAAEKADFPVYLKGLGTVQPFNTVTVRSRVDGEVIKIGFRQGEMVKEGALIAEIDPRPYQAALDQAEAKKKQDEFGPCQRPPRPGAVHRPGQAELRHPPAARYADCEGERPRIADQG